MAGLDGETGAFIPFGGGAGIVGGRTLAAQLVEAPAQFRAFVIKGFRKQPLVIERPPVAAIMNSYNFV